MTMVTYHNRLAMTHAIMSLIPEVIICLEKSTYHLLHKIFMLKDINLLKYKN